MNAIAQQNFNFKKQAVQKFMDTWPGVLVINSASYKCGLQLGPVTLSIPGEGTIEHRGFTAKVFKTSMRDRPSIGTIVTVDDVDYIINSVGGRHETDPHWNIIAIEKDRV